MVTHAAEWSILIFVPYIVYLIRKNPKTTTEKPVPKAKAEQPTATEVAKATPKKPSSDQKTRKRLKPGLPYRLLRHQK
jgi:hypothetical protein